VVSSHATKFNPHPKSSPETFTSMTSNLAINSLFNVRGKIALLSGGASGIGQMIATGLVVNGAKIYIVSRKEKQLKEVSENLTKQGPGTCYYLVGDLSSRAGCENVIKQFREKESKLHILVNNSGATWGAPWDQFPEKEGWDRVLSLNVKSLFYMTQGLSDLLSKDATNVDPGRVINISSVASITPSAEGRATSAAGHGTWSYSTSKAAVNQLTKNMAVTLIYKFVTCNAILPGIFPSRMTAFALNDQGSKEIASRQPAGRFGQPSDMAGLALFLCSPASSHITGATIAVDGGATISRL